MRLLCFLLSLSLYVVSGCGILTGFSCFFVFRESAATLEAESGYSMEAPEVSEFRLYILEARWNEAEAALIRLGVTEDGGLWVISFGFVRDFLY